MEKFKGAIVVGFLILAGALSAVTVAFPHYDKNDTSYSISDGIPDN